MAVTPFKERVECALPARMMFAVSMMEVFGFNDEEKGRAELDRMRELLRFACVQPLEGLALPVAKVVAKQINRLQEKGFYG